LNTDTSEEPDKSAQKYKAEQKNTNKVIDDLFCIEYNQKGYRCQEENFVVLQSCNND
jgi:hypothetical protein